ncbi:hypothetical protein CRG98_033030 [Punica granatum]|uniref:Uncharacterized protein n=1 Tax=Punica granatum TaxID=22663 RepID=A0A2I0IRR5_PUNGR|nr:hypothetical protein CRG98_033030 [Punica granatum]
MDCKSTEKLEMEIQGSQVELGKATLCAWLFKARSSATTMEDRHSIADSANLEVSTLWFLVCNGLSARANNFLSHNIAYWAAIQKLTGSQIG